MHVIYFHPASSPGASGAPAGGSQRTCDPHATGDPGLDPHDPPPEPPPADEAPSDSGNCSAVGRAL